MKRWAVITVVLYLLVRTPERVGERIELGDFFMREIVTKGKVLYEAAHG